jgi:hypothetical protein
LDKTLRIKSRTTFLQRDNQMRMTLKIVAAGASLLPLLFSGGTARAQYSTEYCREYTKTIQVGNRQQSGYGTACLQPNGDWRIVSTGEALTAQEQIQLTSYDAPQRIVFASRQPHYIYAPAPPYFYSRTTYYKPQPLLSFNFGPRKNVHSHAHSHGHRHYHKASKPRAYHGRPQHHNNRNQNRHNHNHRR